MEVCHVPCSALAPARRARCLGPRSHRGALRGWAMLEQTFPSREALRRLPVGVADVAVFLGALALLYLLARVGAGAIVRFVPPQIVPGVSLDPANLPYYAARS